MEHTLSSFEFSEADILQIINSQDSNKGRVNDMISICLLKNVVSQSAEL